MPAALRAACGVMGVAAGILALVLPAGRVSTACLALGLLALVLLRERTRPRVSDFPRLPSSPPPPTPSEPRDLVDLIEAQGRDEQKRGWSCIAFEFPFFAGPPDEFADVLARHEAAIRAQLPGILFLARKERHFKEPFDWIEQCAAEIDLHGGSAPLRLVVRSGVFTLRRFRSFLSIHHGGFGYPGHRRMRVVVVDEDAVSMHKLELITEQLPGGAMRRELALVRDVVRYEPVRQEVRQDGPTAWTRTWRATASSPVHEERIVLRPPAATGEEYLDRLFAACERQLRRRVATALQDGIRLNQLLLWLTPPGDEWGACANVAARTRAGWLEFVERWPQAVPVVQRPWPRGWVPVLVTRGQWGFGGIRWLAATPDADPSARPPATSENAQYQRRRAERRAQ
jgi:hypothetical protein